MVVYVKKLGFGSKDASFNLPSSEDGPYPDGTNDWLAFLPHPSHSTKGYGGPVRRGRSVNTLRNTEVPAPNVYNVTLFYTDADRVTYDNKQELGRCSEKLGFGCQDKRFVYNRAEGPSPGAYQKLKWFSPLSNPSHSIKGYGSLPSRGPRLVPLQVSDAPAPDSCTINRSILSGSIFPYFLLYESDCADAVGFGKQEVRFKQVNNLNPAPNAYQSLKRSNDIANPSHSFRGYGSLADGAQRFHPPLASVSPAPNAYQMKVPINRRMDFSCAAATAAFLGPEQRPDSWVKHRAQPAPNQYQVEDCPALKRTYPPHHSVFDSHSSQRDEYILKSARTLPAPCDYDTRSHPSKATSRPSASFRSDTRRVRFLDEALRKKELPSPADYSWCQATSRFRRTLSSIPRPPSPRPDTPTPGPGHYDVVQGDVGPRPSFLAAWPAFLSSALRWSRNINTIPGPGTYDIPGSLLKPPPQSWKAALNWV